MTERMSDFDFKVRFIWLDANVQDGGQAKEIAADWKRARQRELELEEGINRSLDEQERLAAALDAATSEIERLKQSCRDKSKLEDRIRRIVREEIRNARQRVTAVYPSGQHTIDNHPLDTLFWDDEEPTDG